MSLDAERQKSFRDTGLLSLGQNRRVAELMNEKGRDGRKLSRAEAIMKYLSEEASKRAKNVFFRKRAKVSSRLI